MKIGRALRLVRTQRRLNQRQVAELSGVSVSYLSLLERDKRDPVFSTICNLSAALDIPLVILLFLASSEVEIEPLGQDLIGKLSVTALSLLGEY